MTNRTSHTKDKLGMMLKAAFSRPEAPKLGEQMSARKQLFDFDEHFNSQLRNEENASIDRVAQMSSKNGGGSSTDAFFEGFDSGMKKKSILDDKERMAKYKTGMEKLAAMIENQNMELAKQQRLHSARQAIMPNWMAYSQNFRGMPPADREQAIESMIDKYNQVAGTNYRRGSVDGREPWKVTVVDGDEAQIIDLMDLMKSPEEMRMQMMMQSPAYQQGEAELRQEHNMDMGLKNAMLQQRQAKANEASMNSPESIQQRNQEMVDSGQLPKGAISFDSVKGAEQKERIKEIREEVEKLKGAEAGIEALRKMEEIFKKHPKISTSLARWTNSQKEDSLLGNFLKDFVNNEERDAILELDKHAATLALGTIQQFKGQRPTDILKKLIKETNPSGNFTPGAFKPIKEQYMKQFEKQRKKSIEAEKGWRGRYFPSYEVDEIGDLQAEDPTLTPEMIEEAQRRLNGQ